MGKLYSYITGDDILTINEVDTEPIIEGMLYKGQYVLFTAEEKVGKTVLSQQITCSLSTGKALFNTFDIPREYKVWYMFNEVRMDELKDRFLRMSRGIGINTANITLVPFKFHFNTDTGRQQIDEIITENNSNPPDVIILDALYKAVLGSLKDDNVVNLFNHNFGYLASGLGGCARIAVHHLTKPSKDEAGNFRKRTDKDAFGSAFLAADVDHIFRLEKWGTDPQTRERALKCETQRSGDIMETTRLIMIEPDPLYYDLVGLRSEGKAEVVKLLNVNKGGMNFKDMMKKSKKSHATLYRILRELVGEELVVKSSSRPVIYEINRREDNIEAIDTMCDSTENPKHRDTN